eukprot:6486049-Amphidinium_carterae.1
MELLKAKAVPLSADWPTHLPHVEQSIPHFCSQKWRPGSGHEALSSAANARRAPHMPPSGAYTLGNRRPMQHQTAGVREQLDMLQHRPKLCYSIRGQRCEG